MFGSKLNKKTEIEGYVCAPDGRGFIETSIRLQKEAWEQLNEAEPEPERLSAEEVFIKGQSAREELIEQLLDLIYKRIKRCSSEGQIETIVTINYLNYKGVLNDVITMLVNNGYEVSGEVCSDISYDISYGNDKPAYQGYNLTVNWNKSGEPWR